MMRWIRWRYLLPRLALVVAGVTLAQWGLPRLVRWSVVESGEHTVGARVEVGETRVSLLGGDVLLRDIRVANPSAPMRNLVEADRCELDLDAGALLHKQAVVDHGALTGLRFGTPRETSGALAGAEAEEASQLAGWLDDQALIVAGEWLDNLHSRFQENVVDQLQSVQLTEDLLRRWPQQYSELKDRAAQLRRQTADLESQARAAQENPLRHVDALAKLPGDVAEIRDNLTKLSKEVEGLPDIAEADRRAIVAARQHDEQFIRDQLHFDTIDSSVLTAYLLQEQLKGPVADLMGWVQWVRRIVPATTQTTEPKRKRGQDIYFTGSERKADVLIRALDLRGSGRLGGQSFDLAGTLNDFSNRPSLSGQPMRLKLTTSGSLQVQLQATIDRTGPTAKDQFLVDCGGIVLPKFRLGHSDKLRLSIAPSTATLNISVTLEGNKLSGDIQLVQKQVQITPSVGEELARFQVVDALDESLRDIHSVATRISLGGTLEQPKFELWSNLGPAVAEAMNGSIEKATANYAHRALAASQQQVDEKLADLDRQIAEQQAALKPQLSASTDALKQLVGGERLERVSMEQPGQQLPASSMFK
ncbi:MAG TPA: TIGR03545 family protein [Lacipirellulaceae bacterium]|jgi:uncharacterized protein (TIGR03545 family)